MLVAVAALAEHHAILLAGIGLGGSFLLIALYAVYVSQRVVRPMTEAIQTERKVLEPDRYVETMERLRVHPEQRSADELELYGGRSFVGREVTQERELDRLKDEFVATVSHELRTPLTSLMGFLEMVRNGEAGELTPEQERFLAIVSRSSERLRRLVGDLLFVARLDAGGLQLHVEDGVSLDEVVAEAVEAASANARSHDVALGLERDGEVAVRGDRAPGAARRQPALERGQVHAGGRQRHRPRLRGGRARRDRGRGHGHRHPEGA